MKLDNEPRLQGAGPAIMEWARRVVQAVNQASDWITGWAFMKPDTAAGNTGPYVTAPAGSSAVLTLDKPASGFVDAINARTGGVIRWQMLLGNATAESGSNAGSDFSIGRFSDAGASLGSPLSILRATGQVLIDTAGLTSTGTISTTAAHGSTLYSPNGGANLNGNYGTTLTGYVTSAGPVYYQRLLSGNPNWGATVLYSLHVVGVSAGFRMEGNAATIIDFVLSSGGTYGSILAAAFTVSSDERIKRDIQPLPANRAAFMAIKPIRFKWRENCQGDTIEGFSAQNLQACIPAAVRGDVTAVDADGKPRPAGIDMVPVQAAMVLEVQALIREVAQLRAEIDTLKGAANG